MKSTHICSLPLHANPGRLDPCVGRNWIALPITKTVIGLWKISQPAKGLPVELAGHSREINALAFSSDRYTYLVSACSEKILLWELLSEKDGHISSRRFCSLPGETTILCLNNNNDTVAASIKFNIFIFKDGSQGPLTILEAHRGMITKLAFCPHYSATLISLSDDRCFCIWDVRDSVLLYSSKIISASPLISISMNWTNPQVAIGTADGNLMVIDLTDGNDFRQLSNVNISLALQKHNEKTIPNSNKVPGRTVGLSKYGTQLSTDLSSLENTTSVQSSESMLCIEYVHLAQVQSSISDPINNSSGVGSILNEKSPLIFAITSNAIVQLYSRTLEIMAIVNMKTPMCSQSFRSTKYIGPLSYAASCQTGPSQIVAVVGTMFETKIEMIQLELVHMYDQQHSDKSDQNFLPSNFGTDIFLSIIPASTVSSSSPLKSEMLPPVASRTVTKGEVATGKKKLPSLMNQPITFKSKIKSSGYSEAPRSAMFKPATTKNKVLSVSGQRRTKQEQMRVSLGKMLKSEYDSRKGPPLVYCDTFQVDHQESPVFSLRFCDDGSSLGCALSNTCALTLNSPYSKHMSNSFVGHKNAVNSVYWTSHSAHLLTASDDKTVLLWNRTGGDPILSLSHHHGTVRDINPNNVNISKTQKVTSSASSSSSSSRKMQSLDSNSSKCQPSAAADIIPFTKEIKHAQFFYVDKFILLTHGPELLLYKYYITSDRDDIKRYQSKNRCKLVASWHTASSSFTACAAVNSFFSHLVICTTSGRNMEVYDLNKSVLAHVFTECHSRPPHCVTINEGSCFASQTSEAYNVTATASSKDPIKLWDLRMKSNVQALQGHMNNAYACQIAFSPCGNYLASGSENHLVYVYDLRKGTYLDCLRGHNDVVTSVAFHPGYPLLASGSLNGKIVFFKSK